MTEVWRLENLKEYIFIDFTNLSTGFIVNFIHLGGNVASSAWNLKRITNIMK